jgi:hypothetical protein
MRHARAITFAFVLATAACTLLALRIAATPAAAEDPPEDAAIPPVATAQSLVPAPPDSLARLVAGRDPFRLMRSPASARFDPVTNAPGAPPPPMPPRPALSLAGIVMGAEPSALVEGIPGSDRPRLLRIGERAGDFLVRQITAERVIIAGHDTTWTLRVRNRYQ